MSVALKGFPGGSDGKASAHNIGDLGSIPRSGRSPREGNGNPLQYSCLENSMDGGAWWATVNGVAKSRTLLSDFTFFVAPEGFPDGATVKNLPADTGDTSLIPGLGRSPGKGSGNPLQYSCLENPMDRGGWQATVHGVVSGSFHFQFCLFRLSVSSSSVSFGDLFLSRNFSIPCKLLHLWAQNCS